MLVHENVIIFVSEGYPVLPCGHILIKEVQALIYMYVLNTYNSSIVKSNGE